MIPKGGCCGRFRELGKWVGGRVVCIWVRLRTALVRSLNPSLTLSIVMSGGCPARIEVPFA